MKRNYFLILLLAFAGILLYESFSPPSVRSPLTVETKRGASGLSSYTIIYKNNANIDFETIRPDKSDTNILLCIAGAFTKPDKSEIDGMYICKGKMGNKDKINATLGGGIAIMDGECTIFPTSKGRMLSDDFTSPIVQQKGSLFQQIQMIENGKVSTFKDTVLFLRRGIVIFNNGKIAIVESSKAITLKTFAADVAALDAKDLLYTDMGAWDEGWYRSPSNGNILPLGKDHSQTAKQSNWVIFRK